MHGIMYLVYFYIYYVNEEKYCTYLELAVKPLCEAPSGKITSTATKKNHFTFYSFTAWIPNFAMPFVSLLMFFTI